MTEVEYNYYNTQDYLCDYIASQKYITGEWFVVPEEGTLYNKFHQKITGTLNHGYLYIGTHWGDAKKNISYARAVWICAHGGRGIRPGYQIDHRNGDTLDNRISNLFEVTPSENCRNPNTLRTGVRHSQAKQTYEQVIEIRRLHAGGMSYAEISRMYNTHPYSIAKICRGITYKDVPFPPQEGGVTNA